MLRNTLGLSVLALVIVPATYASAQAPVLPSAHHDYRVVTVAEGLVHPWSIAALPDGDMLITERPGRVRLLEADGALRDEPVATVPVSALGEEMNRLSTGAFEDEELTALLSQLRAGVDHLSRLVVLLKRYAAERGAGEGADVRGPSSLARARFHRFSQRSKCRPGSSRPNGQRPGSGTMPPSPSLHRRRREVATGRQTGTRQTANQPGRRDQRPNRDTASERTG